MDYDPIVLAAAHSSAKVCITESMFRGQPEMGCGTAGQRPFLI